MTFVNLGTHQQHMRICILMDHDFELCSDHVLSSQLLSRLDEGSTDFYVQDDSEHCGLWATRTSLY